MPKQPTRRVVDIKTREEHIGDIPATQNTGGLSVDDITEIKVALAEQRRDLKNILDNLNSMVSRHDTQVAMFVPRSELEARISAMETRITKIEANQSKAAWAIVTAWIAGLGVVGWFSKGG